MEIKTIRKRAGIYKNCERCNKSFYVYPSQEKRRFCSRECSKNREQVKCICGKVFEAHKSSIRKYCSSDCSNRASKGKKAHPNTLKAIEERKRLEKERNDQKGLDKKSIINNILYKKISPPDLAKQIGVSRGTVLNRMREYNINVANYPKLNEIRKIHHAKGNINRSSKTKAKVSKRMLGENNPRWLEGFSSYETYKDNLFYAEQIRRAPDNEKILEVKCTYCGRWLKPTVPQASARARYLQSKEGAIHESRFYCSDSCKNACPIFKRIRWSRGYRPATSREVQPELRQMRLFLDDYECQKCGKTIDEVELHCHHYTGTMQNPIESADVDNTITVCKKCHKWVHTQEGCRYFELKCT
ncbi:MAG: HNH endonuclease signature motif containing protein [Deltaproteobacteria bacterium]|nr:HNH endonuclease signature motif containing protein [Deltaproteobacteria bacterium]